MKDVVKRFDTFSAIRSAYSNGELSATETVDILATSKLQKPWHTKEWRELRNKLLKESCTQCGSDKKPLVLQHTWHPRKLSEIIKNVKREYNTDLPDDEYIFKKALSEAFTEHDRYLTCDDTTTFCRKCAFLWDQKNKKLCLQCKSYIPLHVEESNCFNCFEEEFGIGNWLDEVYAIYNAEENGQKS